MAWSWVRVSSGTSPKLRQCLDEKGGSSAADFEDCVRSVVGARSAAIEEVTFEPNGKWAWVRIRWDSYDERNAIFFDLEVDREQEMLSAEEMDRLRSG